MKIAYDSDRDVLEIEGTKYSGELFRALGFAPIGTVLEIVSRENGTVTMRTVLLPAKEAA